MKSPLLVINIFLLGLVVLLSININPNSNNLPSFAKKAIAAVSSILGEGTTNYLAAFGGATEIGNSVIYDDGSNIGIGTASPGYKLEVNGTIRGKCVGTSPQVYLYDDVLCINNDCKDAWPSGGGGGVSKIIAGSNITISPTTGIGDVTINATASSHGQGSCSWHAITTHGNYVCSTGYYVAGICLTNSAGGCSPTISGTQSEWQTAGGVYCCKF